MARLRVASMAPAMDNNSANRAPFCAVILLIRVTFATRFLESLSYVVLVISRLYLLIRAGDRSGGNRMALPSESG